MKGARSCVVGWGIMLQDVGRGIDSKWCNWIFQQHKCPGVDSASNRYEYQKCSWRVEGGRPARKADNFVSCEPIVYEMCGSLDVSQFYGRP
jgi:hypothetical protein